MDRRRWREGDLADRGGVRRLHQLFCGSVEEFAHKNELLKGHCRDIGRDEAGIVRSSNRDVIIGHTQGEIDDRLAGIRDRMERGGLPDDKVEERMRVYTNSIGCGTPEQIVERLRALEKAGLTYCITLFPEAAYDTSGIEAFEREVIPELITRDRRSGRHWGFLHHGEHLLR